MVYPCLSKKEILDFYDEEMKMLIIERGVILISSKLNNTQEGLEGFQTKK